MNTELRNTTDILKEYLSYIKDDTQIKKVRTGEKISKSIIRKYTISKQIIKYI